MTEEEIKQAASDLSDHLDTIKFTPAINVENVSKMFLYHKGIKPKHHLKIMKAHINRDKTWEGVA